MNSMTAQIKEFVLSIKNDDKANKLLFVKFQVESFVFVNCKL
jgi:hypothetical protein